MNPDQRGYIPYMTAMKRLFGLESLGGISTERTQEIGVRRAVGASRRDILRQFLLEALFLSLVGGLLDVLFGISGARLVAVANRWTVVVTPQTTVLAFGFSAIVGVFFGYYPALKASRLNPIEALRYE